MPATIAAATTTSNTSALFPVLEQHTPPSSTQDRVAHDLKETELSYQEDSARVSLSSLTASDTTPVALPPPLLSSESTPARPTAPPLAPQDSSGSVLEGGTSARPPEKARRTRPPPLPISQPAISDLSQPHSSAVKVGKPLLPFANLSRFRVPLRSYPASNLAAPSPLLFSTVPGFRSIPAPPTLQTIPPIATSVAAPVFSPASSKTTTLRLPLLQLHTIREVSPQIARIETTLPQLPSSHRIASAASVAPASPMEIDLTGSTPSTLSSAPAQYQWPRSHTLPATHTYSPTSPAEAAKQGWIAPIATTSQPSWPAIVPPATACADKHPVRLEPELIEVTASHTHLARGGKRKGKDSPPAERTRAQKKKKTQKARDDDDAKEVDGEGEEDAEMEEVEEPAKGSSSREKKRKSASKSKKANSKSRQKSSDEEEEDADESDSSHAKKSRRTSASGKGKKKKSRDSESEEQDEEEEEEEKYDIYHKRPKKVDLGSWAEKNAAKIVRMVPAYPTLTPGHQYAIVKLLQAQENVKKDSEIERQMKASLDEVNRAHPMPERDTDEQEEALLEFQKTFGIAGHSIEGAISSPNKFSAAVDSFIGQFNAKTSTKPKEFTQDVLKRLAKESMKASKEYKALKHKSGKRKLTKNEEAICAAILAKHEDVQGRSRTKYAQMLKEKIRKTGFSTPDVLGYMMNLPMTEEGRALLQTSDGEGEGLDSQDSERSVEDDEPTAEDEEFVASEESDVMASGSPDSPPKRANEEHTLEQLRKAEREEKAKRAAREARSKAESEEAVAAAASKTKNVSKEKSKNASLSRFTTTSRYPHYLRRSFALSDDVLDYLPSYEHGLIEFEDLFSGEEEEIEYRPDWEHYSRYGERDDDDDRDRDGGNSMKMPWYRRDCGITPHQFVQQFGDWLLLNPSHKKRSETWGHLFIFHVDDPIAKSDLKKHLTEQAKIEGNTDTDILDSVQLKFIEYFQPTEAQRRQNRLMFQGIKRGVNEPLPLFFARFEDAAQRAYPGESLHSRENFDTILRALGSEFIRAASQWTWVSPSRAKDAEYNPHLIASWPALKSQLQNVESTMRPADKEELHAELLSEHIAKTQIRRDRHGIDLTDIPTTGNKVFAKSARERAGLNVEFVDPFTTPQPAPEALQKYHHFRRQQQSLSALAHNPRLQDEPAAAAAGPSRYSNERRRGSAFRTQSGKEFYTGSRDQGRDRYRRDRPYDRNQPRREEGLKSKHYDPSEDPRRTKEVRFTTTTDTHHARASQQDGKGDLLCQECCLTTHNWDRCPRNPNNPEANSYAQRYLGKGPNPKATPEARSAVIAKYGRIGAQVKGNTSPRGRDAVSRRLSVGAGGQITYVTDLLINGIPLIGAVIDSGSENTLMSADYYHRHVQRFGPLGPKPDWQIRGLNLQKIPCLGVLAITMTVRDPETQAMYSRVQSVQVIPHLSNDLILGSDMLHSFFTDMQLSTGQCRVRADLEPTDKRDKGDTSTVITNRTTIIMPRQAAKVMVHLARDFWVSPSRLVIVRPIPVYNEHGHCKTLTFVPHLNNGASMGRRGYELTLINGSSEIVELSAGTAVGRAYLLPEDTRVRPTRRFTDVRICRYTTTDRNDPEVDVVLADSEGEDDEYESMFSGDAESLYGSPTYDDLPLPAEASEVTAMEVDEQ